MDVSVVIPVYNVERYLTECLESVQANVARMDAEERKQMRAYTLAPDLYFRLYGMRHPEEHPNWRV